MSHNGVKVQTYIYAAAVIFLLMVCAVAIKSAQAAEYEEAPRVVTAEFSLYGDQDSTSSAIIDGQIVTFGIDYIPSMARSLSETRNVWGDNGFARMEYIIELVPSGNYTRINKAYGLAVTGRLTGVSNERLTIVRSTETASYAAIVEGYAKFDYLGVVNASLWQKTGGVRTSIKNDKVTVTLY